MTNKEFRKLIKSFLTNKERLSKSQIIIQTDNELVADRRVFSDTFYERYIKMKINATNFTT